MVEHQVNSCGCTLGNIVRTILPKVLTVSGPTASGKSELAVILAEKYRGEVVNADSMQVYRCMTIGTAAPSGELFERVPHHLYGIVPPDGNFSAADYCREARKAIRSILERNRLPVVCGGTGLYIKVLFGGINSSPPADYALRRELTEFADSKGNQALLDQLAAVDPETAAKLNANDRVRIIRALEVYRQSGTPFSSFHSDHGFSEEWCRTLKIGIETDRDLLYERIEQRVDRMFSDGLIDEVRNLVETGHAPQLKSMSSIGYKEVCSYLAGGMTLAETVELVKRNTRRYAKRQLTWFRSDAAVRWFRYPESLDEIVAAVDEFLISDDEQNQCGTASK